MTGFVTNIERFFSILKVQTKTVAQCVEFYYTYKKQVKIGRNGILTFGPPDSPVEKHTEAVVDVKVEWLMCTKLMCHKALKSLSISNGYRSMDVMNLKRAR